MSKIVAGGRRKVNKDVGQGLGSSPSSEISSTEQPCNNACPLFVSSHARRVGILQRDSDVYHCVLEGLRGGVYGEGCALLSLPLVILFPFQLTTSRCLVAVTTRLPFPFICVDTCL